MNILEPAFNHYEKARQNISKIIRPTPLDLSYSLSKQIGAPVYIKQEHYQLTGSFKLRGASNAVLNLSEEEKGKGVIGVSTGNYGKALACAAKSQGVKCIICMSSLVPQNKVDGIKNYGAEIIIHGKSQDEAENLAKELSQKKGYVMLPPFDHLDIIAGQGTLGLEILEQVPNIKNIILQVSGGGLLCGIAAVLKARKPDVKVYGVSMKRGAAMYESLKSQKPILVEELPTLADSLGGGIGLENKYTFAMIQKYIHDFITVDEPQIAQAIRYAYHKERQVIEGAGGAGLAALLTGKLKLEGDSVIVFSGKNIDMNLHQRIILGEDVDLMKEVAS